MQIATLDRSPVASPRTRLSAACEETFQREPATDCFIAGPVSLSSRGSFPQDLQGAISNHQAAKDKPYFDVAADVAEVQQYYQGVDSESDEKTLFRSLHKLVKDSHIKHLAYQPSLYVYPWVDLRPDLSLQSIYSSNSLNAADVITSDYEHAKYWNAFGEMAATAAFSPERAAAQIALTASSAVVNCEHVVCQSWFDYDKIAKGDLHHLFGCDPASNSYRNNHPLAIVDDPVSTMDHAGTLSSEGGFQPEAGKGPAARATLYFLVRYPKVISQYSQEAVGDLLRWNREDPPGLYEKHRNQAIEELQGNRNPFIDHPEWADKVDFTLGTLLHPR